MTAPTHILGGFVFAGTLCSFTDVNVFENPKYLIVCALCSILPDIDTTKSWLGKLLYPVSWLIYHKFGHRTITHSLLFFALVWALMFSLTKFGIIADPNYLKIVLFSILGHYVFDMLTVSGVPLFYPFKKNPCVIPGNPAYRFNTSCIRSELLICGICGILCFSMQPLFAHGFWTAYNRQFATIRHVDRENRNSEFYIICEYSYILNAELFEGEAIVIDSKTNELTLFDRENIFVLNSDDPQLKVNYTRPRLSTIEKRFEEHQFFNITFDSLQNMLSGRLATGLIQSSRNVQYVENAITYHTNFIKFANRFDFRITATADTIRVQTQANIARLEAQIRQAHQRHQAELARWEEHIAEVAAIEQTLNNSPFSPNSPNPNLTYYERNRLQQQLIRLRNRPIERPVFNPPEAQIAELQVQRTALTANPLTFSGHMTIFKFGYEQVEQSTDYGRIFFVRRPSYNGDYILAQASLFPIIQTLSNNN
jgi:inner membrane protein